MIIYRLVKGSPLTVTELDDNFHDVDDRITAIEDNPVEARSIDEITAVGSTLVILYTDSTEDTVPIPVMTLRGRGNWAPFTAYLPNDLVTANSVIYLILFAHTSAATFDAGANDGLGHDYYAELFPIPELALPPGGGTGYVLSKVSDSDFDMEWQARGIPDGGISGQVLTKLTSDDLDVDWRTLSALVVPTSQVITDSEFTPDATDTNTFMRCATDATGGCIISIQSGVFDLDTELIFRQENDGGVEVIADSSDANVIIEPIDGFEARTDRYGAIIHCKFVEDSTDGEVWAVWGLLVETSV